MSPFQGFMQDLLDEVSASLDVSCDELTVDWARGAAWIDPVRSVSPPPAGWMRTEAGWVPLTGQGGSE